jgi:peptidoglycan/LPS O-acetylase OafA/YrhL
MLFIPFIIFILGLRVGDSMGYYYWQIPGRLIEFTTGVALASVTLSNQKKFRKVKLESRTTFLVGILSLVLILNLVNKNGGEWRISTWWPAVTVGLSLAFFLIMAGITPPLFKGFQKLSFPIALISELSYGIYLFHFAVIGFLAPKVVQIMNGHPNAITGAAIGAVICFPISVLLSWLISPIERFFMGLRPVYWNTAKRDI